MPNPAEVTDLESRWRSLSTAEQVVAQTMLDDAWQIMLAKVPYLQARLDDSTLAAELVIAVECAMTLRVLRNPLGKSQESIDDYSYMRDSAVATGMLYLGDDELALLSPSGDTGSAYTITPYGVPGYATSLPLNVWELNV